MPHPVSFDGQRRQLTLLHAADLHLGSDDYPREAFQGLESVIALTRRLSPDALLIAGDLLDAQNIPLDTVSYTFGALGGIGCPVVVVPGNHDTLLTAPSFSAARLPANVRVLLAPQGEAVALDALGLTIWGRPVYDHSPEFRPLQGLGPRPPKGWYVALAHGLVANGSALVGRSSPITAAELAQAECDYIALGHVHRFREVTHGGPPAFYSGAPSGTREPTVALVRLDPSAGVSVRPVSL
ncbi:MAG: DNA repair exonuclease [Chloroflexi bacterium]|nr:DNA repair exonuclease [Chloroflexota bacterium]